MTPDLGRKTVLSLVLVLAASSLLAAIPNWPAPATWSPAKSRGGLTTMGDVTSPLPFIGANPCRIADTRLAPGPYGAPALAGGVPRNFTLTGQCGIPVGAGAVSLNVTVTNTQGPGFILIYPAGGMQPTVSTLNYVANQTIANAAVVPLGMGGAVTVIAGVSGTDLILDTNGYYASTPATASNPFFLSNSGRYAIYGQTSSSSSFATGVFGQNTATSGPVLGVRGEVSSGDANSAGVRGDSDATTGQAFGVLGAINSDSSFTAGVVGQSFASSGFANGVMGRTFSTASSFFGTPAPCGVLGIDVAGAAGGDQGGFSSAGVDGRGHNGVIGRTSTSGGNGVSGVTQTTAGLTTYGALGTTTHGVWAFVGDIGCSSCTKPFVDPHPTDPTKEIRFVALEGNEAGTYFRGTAETVGREYVIQVPEDFRLVTDAEGMTVQLTPVGAPASMYIVSEDLNQIVVRSSRDVKFHYLVHGIRETFKNIKTIQEMSAFLPQTPDGRMPPGWAESTKQRLIANGTYNPDGTLNSETAERAGWVKMWADREAQAKAAASANAATRAALPGEK